MLASQKVPAYMFHAPMHKRKQMKRELLNLSQLQQMQGANYALHLNHCHLRHKVKRAQLQAIQLSQNLLNRTVPNVKEKVDTGTL